MKSRCFGWCHVWLLVICGAWIGCTTGKVVKTGAGGDSTTSPTRRAVSALSSAACIKGRVVDEKNKGVPYVFVQTKPITSPAVTDRNGNYEFCHLKKNVDGSVESTRHPIPKGQYTILVKKNGYVAKPLKVQYQGKGVKLASIQLMEKQFKPGKIQTKGEDKPDHRKLPSGITGKHPKGG